MKNIVFFDLDNTIVNGYTQKLLIKYLYDKNRVSIFFLLKIYLWFVLYKIYPVKSPEKIMEKSILFVKDLDLSCVDSILEDFFSEIVVKRINKKIKKKIEGHLKNNDYIYIISSAISPLVKVIGKKLNINNIYGSNLEIVDKKYTGKLDGRVIYGKEKAIIGANLLKKHSFSFSYCYADHYSDLLLFNLVNKKIAVCPSKELLKVIDSGWEVIYC